MNGTNSDSRISNQELVNIHSEYQDRPIIAVSEEEVGEIKKELVKEVKKYLNVT